MGTHVKVVAGLYFVVASLFVAGAFFAPLLIGIVANFVAASGEEGAGAAAAFLGLTGAMLSLFLGAMALPFGICGWGLLKLRRWGRIMGIILGAVSLTHFPFGTLIGVYALIVLFHRDTEKMFPPPPGA